MSSQLGDIPVEVLIEIFSHITNIRNKVVLLRVNRKFYQAGIIALKTQSYKLACKSDYIYIKPTHEDKKLEETPVLPLHKLLPLAPRLTHLVDHPCLITPSSSNSQKDIEPYNLQYTTTISLNLRTDEKSISCPSKMKLFLNNCPKLKILYLRLLTLENIWPDQTSWCDKYHLPFSVNLEVFEVYIAPVNKLVTLNRDLFSNFFGIISGQAPNLKKFSLYLNEGDDPDYSTVYLIEMLSKHCPKLQYLELHYENGEFDEEDDRIDEITYTVRRYKFKELKHLVYLSILGVKLTETFWSLLLSKCPNLKFFAYDRRLDKRMMPRLIETYCCKVYYDDQKPNKVKKEFENFCKKTNDIDFKMSYYNHLTC